jgi:inositol transport system ATP-binding protein
MPHGPLLEVRNVTKSFAGVKALDGVGLSVARGEVHALMGENGAGKSTLMRILGGLLPPDAGEMLLENKPLRPRGPHDALCSGIAMIHQELLPFRDLSVAANIAIGRESTRRFPGWLDHAAMNREASSLLTRLGVSIDPQKPMRELGIARMQSVEIAKALAHDARLIIMDEPTTALSAREVDALFQVIGELRGRGVSVIYISHKMDEIFRIADTITVMRDGRHVETRAATAIDEPQLIRLMVGRDPLPRAAHASSPGNPILETRKLGREGKFHDIGFTLRRGEILGIGGLMGAGRSELAHALYGLDPATCGEILVSGKPVRIHSPPDALAAGIALVTEDRKRFGFIPRFSVRENLALSAAGRAVSRRRAEERLADEQITRFSIKASSREQAVAKLSGGNQQKVVIARALLADPDILILDEPTRGIDIGAKAGIHSTITTLARSGKAVLLISSEMPELLALSHRLLVMRGGSITAELDPNHTSQEEIMRHAMPA